LKFETYTSLYSVFIHNLYSVPTFMELFVISFHSYGDDTRLYITTRWNLEIDRLC